jgi:hypothetical protein
MSGNATHKGLRTLLKGWRDDDSGFNLYIAMFHSRIFLVKSPHAISHTVNFHGSSVSASMPKNQGIVV